MKKKYGTYFVCFVSTFALSLCGVLGSVLSILTAFDINADVKVIVAVCVVSGLVLSVLSLLPRKTSFCVFGTAVVSWIAALVMYAEPFVNGFRSSASFLMVRYCRFAEWIEPFYTERELLYYSVTSENTCFFVFFALLFTIIFVFVIANDVSFIVPFSLTLPCLALCLFIVNTAPSAFSVCALFVFWITLVVTAILRHSGRDKGAYGILVTMPILILLSFAIVGFFPQKEYSRPEFVDKANEKIISILNINNKIIIGPGDIEPVSTEGSEGEYILDPGWRDDLHDVGDRHTTGREVMRVYTDYTKGDILIRGRSRGDYISSVWYKIPESYLSRENAILSDLLYSHPDSISIAAINNKLIELKADPEDCVYEMTIDPVNAVASADYRPPYSFPSDVDGTYCFYVPDFDITKANLDSAESFAEAAIESEYSKLVHRQFLQQTYVKSVSDAVNDLGLSKNASLNEKIKAVTSYVRKSAVYTLTPGKATHDFVDYFFQNGKGYCVHFATAATLMFRALGVPARYVTGFIAKAENYDASKGYISVTDNEAHAWVEVYCDGFGWIPVDVTPGYDAGYIPSDESTEVSETSEVSVEISYPEESSLPHEFSRPETSRETSHQTESSAESSDIVIVEPKISGMSPWMKLILIIAGVVLLLISTVVLNRTVRIRIRIKHFTDPDVNKSAVYIWKFMTDLKKYGAADDVRIYDIAEKAKFSRNGITRTEYAEMLSRTEKCAKDLYSSSGLRKRIYLKYFCAVV